MTKWIALALAASLAACSSADNDDPGGDDDGSGSGSGSGSAAVGEPAELTGITQLHNDVRASVDTTGVAGGALPPLAWDDALAATALAWAKKCTDTDGDGLIDHNAGRSDGHAFYVGENIFASSGTATAKATVDGWANERVNYHYDTNTCDAKKVCGHYTQVVWRGTTKLGCAIYTCAKLKYKSSVVCDYGPGGNVSNNRPY